MKYLKQYEAVKNFKAGDYVFITKVSKVFSDYKKLFKITGNVPEGWILHSIVEDDFIGIWGTERLRKATKKEITEAFIKIDTDKYNI